MSISLPLRAAGIGVVALGLAALSGGLLPVDARAANFEGFYIGGQAGYDMYNVDYSATDGVDTLSLEGFSASGAEGGVFVGHGWRFQEAYFGLETFAGYSSAEFTISSTVLPTSTTEAGFTYGAALRAGRIIADNTLIYAKLGVQATKVEQTLTGVGSNDETLNGFGAGGGIEVALNDRATFRVEYQHTWYEDLTFVGGGVTESYEADGGTASVGLAFRFW